jgi:hypothetical protein
MTNGEKLEQIFPNGICPFSKGWLSAKYREPNFPTISLEKAIPIPDGATNGDVIKAMFPSIDASVSGDGDVVDVYNLGIYCQTFDTEWWNAPYRVESEGKE